MEAPLNGKLRRPNSCLHCGSLDWLPSKKGHRFCKDCGSKFTETEVLEPGYVDLDYSLNVLNSDGHSVWCECIHVLFDAQCDIAEGLGIKPGSSFTKWLKSREHDGIIDDNETVQTMGKIVDKMIHHMQHIKSPDNLQMICHLQMALPKARKFVLTYKKR
jgi:hypothetical protein